MPALSMLRPSHFKNTPYRAFLMRETLHLQLRLGISLSKKKVGCVECKGVFSQGNRIPGARKAENGAKGDLPPGLPRLRRWELKGKEERTWY